MPQLTDPIPSRQALMLVLEREIKDRSLCEVIELLGQIAHAHWEEETEQGYQLLAAGWSRDAARLNALVTQLEN